MQQEELKKEELYEIRDLLERVNDSYGHDKLFGTHPRRFMDFTTRTADSAYRKMCPKLHPDNHNQNGYTTTDEKDIATECFVKTSDANAFCSIRGECALIISSRVRLRARQTRAKKMSS